MQANSAEKTRAFQRLRANSRVSTADEIANIALKFAGSAKPLLVKDVENLMVVGKAARATHLAQSSVRVQPIVSQLGQAAGGCTGTAHVYREYNLDMQPTGNSGVLNCGSGDSACDAVIEQVGGGA